MSKMGGLIPKILGAGLFLWAGPPAGKRLTELVHFDHFWFAWAAFFPNTELYEGTR
ncbi:MAG: DUF3179 domain-containing protein [Caldilineaceae bacterium]|nr:DUF3179 domain-containing protein [Caldilineaceae bacterium]